MPETFWTRRLTTPCTGALNLLAEPAGNVTVDWGDGTPAEPHVNDGIHTVIPHTYPTSTGQVYTITVTPGAAPAYVVPATACSPTSGTATWRARSNRRVEFTFTDVDQSVMIDQWTATGPHLHGEFVPLADRRVVITHTYDTDDPAASTFIIDRQYIVTLTVIPGADLAQVEEVDDGPCCPWPINPDCCPGWPTDPDQWTEAHRLAIAEATDVLWRLTAGQYGECAELIRPCRKSCAETVLDTFPFWRGYGWAAGGLLSPYMDGNGRWFNAGCGCGSDCGCTPMCILELPGHVSSVVEVRIDGEVVDPDTYKLDKRPGKARLIRTNEDCWPYCQDLNKDDSEEGTFSVLYMRGRKVPAGGVRAVSLLACELYKLCANQGGCRIPVGIKTISREGLTYDMLPPGGWLETFKQEMPEIYRWVTLVNPGGLRQQSAVFSLDIAEAPMSTRGRITGRPC